MDPAPQLEGLRVGDVMRRRFVTAEPEETLPGARQTMRLARLRHLLVARDDRLLGVISYRTLLESLLEEGLGRDGLGASTVSAAMLPSPECVTPDTPIADAAARLCRYGFGCLPVVEATPGDQAAPRVVGLLTEVDLLRVAFQRRA